MSRLSERWFKFADAISTIIFSFIFFWGAFVYFVDFSGKIIHYINHLSDQTESDAYFSVIGFLVVMTRIIVGYILLVMPFSVIGITILGDKVGDKKQYVLRFPLTFPLFLLRLISRP
ncbi:MAG: hypothetical protein RXR65_04960 [Hydrogenobaculum sp.]